MSWVRVIEGRMWLSLADHLGRLEEEGWRDGQVEGLGRLEVDDELKRHGLLHRQVGRLGAFEDLVDVEGAVRARDREQG